MTRRKYKKHTRGLTETEKTLTGTIRYLLRHGIDVRVSFNIKGTKNEVGLEPTPTLEDAPPPEPAEHEYTLAEIEERYLARQKVTNVGE